MAFIAGYVSARPQQTEAISERVRIFSILPGEPAADFEQHVVPTRFGHLIVKQKPGYPLGPKIVSDGGRNVLATLGFIAGQDAASLLPSCGPTAARSLDDCEGQFVAVFADAATGTVHIVNDRFSSRPFYMLRRDDGIYFSSNLAFLLSLARVAYRPDVAGWLQACAVGHTLGPRTTADGVERLRPATHLTVTPEGVRERQYWRLEHRPDPNLNPVTHSREVFRAFQSGAVFRSKLVEKGVLALSGGLDSRLIAGALPRGANYSAYTFVEKPDQVDTRQTRVAAAVSTAVGLSHHVEVLPARFACPSQVVALTGGMRPYHHMANVMAYVEEMRRQHTGFLLGGGPGDSLAGAFVPTRAYVDPDRTSECIADACWRRLSGAYGWSLAFRDDVIESGWTDLRDALAESFATVTGPTAAHRVTAWAMVYRQSAFTFTSVIHTHPDVTEAACHLDYRYADLMLRVPASWLYGRAFYAYMIHSALPALRHIPYANTGLLLSAKPPTPAVASTAWGRKCERALSRGWYAAGRVARAIRPAGTSVPSLIFRDAALLDEVEDRLHSIPSLRDLLDVPRCEALIARTRAGACPSEEILGGVTSLCMSSAVLPGA